MPQMRIKALSGFALACEVLALKYGLMQQLDNENARRR
jgi:hypothetical protein